MSQWTGKTKGNLLGYKIFAFVLSKFGINAAYFILYFVATYYFVCSLSTTKNSYVFYRNYLKFSFSKTIFSIFKNYIEFGKSLIDRFAIMAGINTKFFTFDFDGEQHLHQIAQEGNGGILISAHVGNWEVAGQLLTRIKTKVNVVMLDAEHEKIKDFLSSFSSSTHLNIIAIKDDISHIYEISSALSRNEFICIHGDRFTSNMKTCIVDFLGKPAHFPIGPMQLAMSLKVPVSLVFAMKESNSHYHFYASKPFTIDRKNKSNEEISFAIRNYAKAVEEKVLEYPHQWFNFYNFWNSSL